MTTIDFTDLQDALVLLFEIEKLQSPSVRQWLELEVLSRLAAVQTPAPVVWNLEPGTVDQIKQVWEAITQTKRIIEEPTLKEVPQKAEKESEAERVLRYVNHNVGAEGATVAEMVDHVTPELRLHLPTTLSYLRRSGQIGGRQKTGQVDSAGVTRTLWVYFPKRFEEQ